MKITRRRVITVGVAAAVLAISITSLASGVSLRQLVKKEVTKQVAKATGPAGATGATGATGSSGAVAFGYVNYVDGTPTIDGARSSGLTAVAEATPAAGNGFACLDVAVPFKTGVVTGISEPGGANNYAPDLELVIPYVSQFSKVCPAGTDLMVLQAENGGAFARGSFTIALF